MGLGYDYQALPSLPRIHQANHSRVEVMNLTDFDLTQTEYYKGWKAFEAGDDLPDDAPIYFQMGYKHAAEDSAVTV